MNIQDELSKEIAKNKNEQIMAEVVAENAKKNYANDLLYTTIGHELKQCNLVYNPIYKKKIRFWKRIKQFLGI